jgi:hypothetical protein
MSNHTRDLLIAVGFGLVVVLLLLGVTDLIIALVQP